MTIENDISEEEMKAIKELRERFERVWEPELLEDNYYLRRFLRAQNFNIDNAERMLRKHFEWRKKYDAKHILKKYKRPEVVEKYASYTIIGYDKEGSVVRYAPTGLVDLAGIMNCVTMQDVYNFLVYEQEIDFMELKKKSKELGRNVEKVVHIADLKNISFAQVTDKKVMYTCILLMHTYMNNYPETLKVGYVLNVSVYFNFIYSLLKNVVPPRILDKIKVYSDDSYKEDLLKIIDADELPAFLGGNKTDPDGNPMCSTLIKRPEGRVPETYYIRKNKQPLSKIKGVKKVTLCRSAFHEINLEVKEPGSYLEWEFETKCRDIGFGLFFNEIVDGKEKITQLMPIQRIDTAIYPETGSFICEKPGTYVIVFDNTYSWVRSKEIYYRTKIISPKEQEAELKGS